MINWTEKLGGKDYKEILTQKLVTTSIRGIAREIDVSYDSVSRLTRKLGVRYTVRRGGGCKFNWDVLLLEYPGETKKEKIRGLLRTQTVREVCETLGVSKGAFYSRWDIRVVKPQKEILERPIHKTKKFVHRRCNYLAELNRWKATQEGQEFLARGGFQDRNTPTASEVCP